VVVEVIAHATVVVKLVICQEIVRQVVVEVEVEVVGEEPATAVAALVT